jgi:hypothetical protein
MFVTTISHDHHHFYSPQLPESVFKETVREFNPCAVSIPRDHGDYVRFQRSQALITRDHRIDLFQCSLNEACHVFFQLV